MILVFSCLITNSITISMPRSTIECIKGSKNVKMVFWWVGFQLLNVVFKTMITHRFSLYFCRYENERLIP